MPCLHTAAISNPKAGCRVRSTGFDGARGYVAAVTWIRSKNPLCIFCWSGPLFSSCNFHCDFCQNWVSSQALRDPASEGSGAYIQEVSPRELVDYALRSGARIIASSYNEPLITSEWAIEIFKLAQQAGLRTVYVSNGFATPEVLHALRPVLDGYKVDLKCMTDEKYRSLGGRLQTVLDTIQLAHDLGMWVEVVTLVIPGFNDGNDELWESARFLVSVSPDIPWHVTSFYPTYKHLKGAHQRGKSCSARLRSGRKRG